MANPTLFLPLLLLAAPAPPDPPDRARGAGVIATRLTIRQRIIVRIPRMPVGREPITATRKAIEWKEKKGEKCVAMERLRGAIVSGPESIDLVMGGERMRAKLDDDCSPMDYYAGFYMKSTPDGMICAKRDSIRTRSGGSCRINAFKRLVPKQ